MLTGVATATMAGESCEWSLDGRVLSVCPAQNTPATKKVAQTISVPVLPRILNSS
jgi:hypothetical protein